MARKSALESGILTDPAFYILSSVLEEKHGYIIMKEIEELTEGTVIIGPASLYTTIKKLLDAGLIVRKESTDNSTKIYEITKKGKTVLEKDITRKRQMIQFATHFINQRKDEQ